jgi:hypothetical protein
MSYLQLAQSVDALAISNEALRLAAVDAVDRSDEAVTEAQQAATDAAAAAASVASLNKVNKQYPFTFVTGQAQYDVGVISGDSTVTTASMALITGGLLDYAFTINDAKKFTLDAPGSYVNGAPMRIVVNARFDDLIQNFDDLQDGLAAENAANYQAEKAERTADYHTYLGGLALEMSVPYAPGIAVIRPAQTVTQNDVLYRPRAEALPFETTEWVTDVTKFVVANDMALRQDLADGNDPAKGAAEVSWDGSTVGAQMNLSKKMGNYTDLRNYTGPATRVWLTQSGLYGVFYWDAGSLAVDNGGTTIVGSDGRRWLRVFDRAPCPEWFGAKGDGSDDGAALTAHLATGLSMYLGEKTYGTTVGLTCAAQYQSVRGASIRSTIKALGGTFDILTFASNSGNGCGVDTLRIDAALMTGGYSLVVNGSNICTIANVRGANGWNGIRVKKANTTVIMNTQMAYYRGTDLFLGDGTVERSDLLKIFGLTLTANESIDAASRPRGFTIDGNFNTIQAFGLVVLKTSTGIHHVNSAATTAGGFAAYYDAEVEFVYGDTARIESGQDIHFTDSYLHGSVSGHGLYVGAGVVNVSAKGRKISGNFKCGLYNAGSKVKLNGVNMGGNSQSGSAAYSAVFCDTTANTFNAIGCETGASSGPGVGTPKHKYGFEAAAGAVDCNWLGGSLRGNVTGEWKDNSGGKLGNVRVIGYSGDSANSDRQYSAIVAADGGSFQVPDNAPTVILNPAATLAAYTVLLPVNPVDGMEVKVATNRIITALTVSAGTGTTGHTVNAKPTTLSAGAGFAYIWRASSLNWFRLY